VTVPIINKLDFLSKCKGSGCNSFSWGILGNKNATWVEKVLDHIALEGKLDRTKDIKFVFNSTNPYDLANKNIGTGIQTMA